MSDNFPSVQARCPACGSSGTLFLGDGGYITCSLVECPTPEAAHEAIEERAGANAYERAINTPPSAEACAVLRQRLQDGTAPRRKVTRRCCPEDCPCDGTSCPGCIHPTCRPCDTQEQPTPQDRSEDSA